jgi:proteasome accessory factor B
MQHIDREIRSNRYPTCSRIAGYFDVSRKSIQRDIDFMRFSLRAPIEYDRKKRGYTYIGEWKLDPTSFLDHQESEALAATSKVLTQYNGTPYYNEVSRAIDKLMQYLPASCSGETLLDIYSFDNPAPATQVDEGVFALLDRAARNRQKVTMIYRASSRNATTERTVHPYRLHFDQSGATWYLIAYCEYRHDIRTFAVCRIHDLKITSDHFVIPDSFSITDYLQKAFQQTNGNREYDISIRFTPYQSQWIREHRWHPTQEIHEHDDGALTLTLKVSALEAVKRWVMRYGAQAEVLQPEELREMIKMEVREMDVVYGKNDSNN